MGFCSCTTKYILFFFNLVCALLGLAVLGIGIYGHVSSHSLNGQLSTSSIVVIVLGAAITLISFFGCWGAIQESRCLLNSYGTILLILLIALIAIGAVIVGNKRKAKEELIKAIDEQFEQALGGDKSAQDEVDVIQSTMHCCGLDGYKYWTHAGERAPNSCCKSKGTDCSYPDMYNQGCEDAIKSAFNYIVHLTGIFTIIVGSVELVGVFMAFFLAHSLRRQELRSYT